MPNTGEIFGRSIGFPPRVGANGQVAWSEGPQNIRESIRIILLTEPGERLMLGEFGGGLRQFLYQPNTLETHRSIQDRIITALELWETRIKIESVTVIADESDVFLAIASIRYKLIATQQQDNITLKIRLNG